MMQSNSFATNIVPSLNRSKLSVTTTNTKQECQEQALYLSPFMVYT